MNFLLRRWSGISIARKLYFSLSIMALLILVELFTLWFSVHTLSAVRAYVGGEGLWSKAQKDAVTSLQRYAQSHQEADYNAYREFMNVPLGDHKARIELLKADPDLSVVRQGFTEGRIDPADIDGIIYLFKRFHRVSYIHKAIGIWTQADIEIDEVNRIGKKIHQQVLSGSGNDQEMLASLNELGDVNRQLTTLEDEFSYTLGEGSRWLENFILNILFIVAITVELTGLLLTVSVSRGIARGVHEIIRASGQIARGHYESRAKIFSEDEIGMLAAAFNKMADNLMHRRNEQHQAELDLKRQIDFAETMLDSSIDVITAIDKDFRYLAFNKKCEQLFGFKKEDVIGKNMFDVFFFKFIFYC